MQHEENKISGWEFLLVAFIILIMATTADLVSR